MCFSARVIEEWKKLKRDYGASPHWAAINTLFWKRVRESERTIRVPKMLELSFENPESAEEADIKNAIVEYRKMRTRQLEQELFKQKTRLADAERKLKVKLTKSASEEVRKASNKVEWIVKEIGHVNRTEPIESDARIYPNWYSMIVVQDGNKRSIIPAQYFCLPPGKPEFMAKKFEGLYTARRDSLEGFWKDLFGRNHALMQITEFWENVSKHDYERRALKEGEAPENVVVHFNPKPVTEMTIACLWSRSNDGLASFAAITDEPTREIAAAGHDRQVVMLKPEHVSAWLTPIGRPLSDFHAMFDDRVKPYFEYRLAA